VIKAVKSMKNKSIILVFLYLINLNLIVCHICKANLLKTSLLNAQATMIVPDSSSAAVIKLENLVFPKEMIVQEQTIPVKLLIKADGTYEILSFPEGESEYSEYIKKALENSIFKPAYLKQQTIDSELVVYFEIKPKPQKANPLLKKRENIDSTVLKEQIENFIKTKSQKKDDLYFQHFFYPMTVFYKGLIYQNHIVRTNQFLTISSMKNNNLDYQNDISLYQFENNIQDITSSKNNSFNSLSNIKILNRKLYPYSPMLVSTEMGMSEKEISYANAEAYKNHLFNVENLNFSSVFYASKGEVPLITESTANSRISMNYQFDKWTVDGGISTISHDYSSKRLNNFYFAKMPEDLINEKSDTQWISTSFQSLYMGYNAINQKMSVSTGQKIKTSQEALLFGFKTHQPLFYNDVDLFIQINDEKSECLLDSLIQQNMQYSLLGLNHRLNLDFLSWNNDIIYHSKNSSKYIRTHFDIPLRKHIEAGAGYTGNTLESILHTQLFMNNQFEKQYDVHTRLYNQYLNMELSIGKRYQNQTIQKFQTIQIKESFSFISLKNSLNIPIQNYCFRMNHMLDFQNSEQLYYTSQLLNKLGLSIEKDLGRHNKIAVGIDTYYADDILSETGIWGYSFVIDTFVKINITKLFDLSVRLHNITNNEHYLAEYLNPTHVSGTIHWNFLN